MLRSYTLTPATKLLLLTMAQHMSEDRRVSVPREDLARQMRVHPQRVAERIRKAKDAGYLTQVGGGYKGTTAIYEGVFPEVSVLLRGTQGAAKRTAPPVRNDVPRGGTQSQAQ